MRIAWERMLSIIIIASTMYFVLSLVSAMIPYEEAPRVEIATDGTTVCVIQSLREAVLRPVGIVLFFSLVSGASAVIVYRKWEPDIDVSKARRFLGRIIAGVLILLFAALICGLVGVYPYRAFRKVTVGPEEIVLSSLYRSWTLPLSDVKDAEVIFTKQSVRGRQSFELQVLVTTIENKRFGSVLVSGLAPNSPEHRKYEAVLGTTVELLKAE